MGLTCSEIKRDLFQSRSELVHIMYIESHYTDSANHDYANAAFDKLSPKSAIN